jgi:hypothetical protein
METFDIPTVLTTAQDLCNAPKTPTHPNGDPGGEYFKCHSGDLTQVFGTWRRLGLPERDPNDTPFTQSIMDYWTSFARTHDPNPDAAYLRARGYVNTTAQIGERVGVGRLSMPLIRLCGISSGHLGSSRWVVMRNVRVWTCLLTTFYREGWMKSERQVAVAGHA